MEPMPPDPDLADTAGRLAAAGIPVTTVSPEALARIAYGDRSSAIVAVVVAPDASRPAWARGSTGWAAPRCSGSSRTSRSPATSGRSVGAPTVPGSTA